MNPKIIIRNEIAADAAAISDVTAAAFLTLEISSHTEQFIVEALRAAKALSVSLVAELEGAVIGHVAFSPVSLSDGTLGWYGLGPVSVLPAYQRQGIGAALIEEGLARLKALSARGCCLVGHPGYYRKFGFSNPSGLRVDGVPPEVFFALSLDGHDPQGMVTFHEGFRADGKTVEAQDQDLPPKETPMDIHTFMQGYKAAWEARDEFAFAALFTEDGEYHNTPFAVQHGPEQLRAYWQRVKLQEDVALRFDVLARSPGAGLAHWHVTYQVASEELFQIWARSTGTNLVARQSGDPLPRMVLDGVLQAEFDGPRCRRCRLWWHSQPVPA